MLPMQRTGTPNIPHLHSPHACGDHVTLAVQALDVMTFPPRVRRPHILPTHSCTAGTLSPCGWASARSALLFLPVRDYSGLAGGCWQGQRLPPARAPRMAIGGRRRCGGGVRQWGLPGAAGGLEAAMQIPPQGAKAEEQPCADNADNQNAVEVEDELIHTRGSKGSRTSLMAGAMLRLLGDEALPRAGWEL